MISVSLVFLVLFSACLRSISTARSPFEIIWNYDNRQIIEKNFTIICEFSVDVSNSAEPIDEQPSQSYPVDLTLEVPIDSISSDFWCELPATPVTDAGSNPSKYACQLDGVPADEQPTITMTLLAHAPGEITPTIRVRSDFLPAQSMEQPGDKTITITVRRSRRRSDRDMCETFRRLQAWSSKTTMPAHD